MRNFWVLFAAAHPILTPVLWISEVLHASPGPKLGDVLPYSFAALNVAVLAALALVPRLSTAVNSAVLALFVSAVGAGLAGEVSESVPPSVRPLLRRVLLIIPLASINRLTRRSCASFLPSFLACFVPSFCPPPPPHPPGQPGGV